MVMSWLKFQNGSGRILKYLWSFEVWGGMVIVVSIMYLVKYGSLAFEFKNMVLKCCSLSLHRMVSSLGKCI